MWRKVNWVRKICGHSADDHAWCWRLMHDADVWLGENSSRMLTVSQEVRSALASSSILVPSGRLVLVPSGKLVLVPRNSPSPPLLLPFNESNVLTQETACSECRTSCPIVFYCVLHWRPKILLLPVSTCSPLFLYQSCPATIYWIYEGEIKTSWNPIVGEETLCNTNWMLLETLEPSFY